MEFNEIVKDLDNSAKIEELIYNATQEAMEFDPYQFEFYDEENNFVFKDAIETLIKEDEGLNTLPQEQKDLIETLLTKKMEYSIRTSYEAKEAATSGSYNDEYQEYYGGQDGAFGHLYERYLDELNYRKPIEEFYDEYLEEQKTR
jgi:hypothetical protein